MIKYRRILNRRKRHSFWFVMIAVLLLSTLIGCGPSPEQLATVNYDPLPSEDWDTTTPANVDLNADLVTELYYNASQLKTLYGLLVVKDGYLVAEEYFNGSSIDEIGNRQSVTKSYISALVEIAIEEGCITSVDQKMLEFFPELADQIKDPRKERITIQHLLQMRAGYPWEEDDAALWDALWSGDYAPMVLHFLSSATPEPTLSTAT